MLNDRWNEVLDAEQKHGFNGQTKGYPNRKLLPEFNDEAVAPVPPKNNHQQAGPTTSRTG